MRLLKDESRTIQLEAFHVFKIFAANPEKPRVVQLILFRNKEKLLRLLRTWATSNDFDEALAGDISAVFEMLEALQAPVKQVSSSSSVSTLASSVSDSVD